MQPRLAGNLAGFSRTLLPRTDENRHIIIEAEFLEAIGIKVISQ